MKIVRFLKDWTLPSAITTGTLIYCLFAFVPALNDAGETMEPFIDTLFPFTVFLTLLATFSKVDFHKMLPACWHLWVMAMQVFFVVLFTLAIALSNAEGGVRILMESALACIVGPCASAAPVVTSKLGGNLNRMTAFVVASSLLSALTIPFIFPLLERHADISFLTASALILRRLFLVIILPLLLGWVVRHYLKGIYRWVVNNANLPFYLWAFSLTITTGITVRNIVHSRSPLWLLLAIAACSLIVCLAQFKMGWAIGNRLQARVEAGQGMAQKNTAMTIWITSVYLHPVASLGPGCYVLWQNIVNSWELYRQKQQNLKNAS